MRGPWAIPNDPRISEPPATGPDPSVCFACGGPLAECDCGGEGSDGGEDE